MSRKIRNIKDVVDWGLCIGCGACYYYCKENAIRLKNVESQGIRPMLDISKCNGECQCLDVCPGYQVDSHLVYDDPFDFKNGHELFGPALEIWEGYAADQEIRYAASSGGALTALALHCLEQQNMNFVLHTGMDPKNPLQNKTFKSFNKDDLLIRTGSRYAPASPCDSLEEIEKSDRPCVFIGKPCDAAAVTMARKKNPKLDKNLGLVLTFFCAGAPSTFATKNLLKKMDVPTDKVNKLRYRGEGWPGEFKVTYEDDLKVKSLSYEESWHELQKFRSLRCHICPDGLGQVGDISCGDGWHQYKKDGNIGQSLILVRTERGRLILRAANKNGYLLLDQSSPDAVIEAQGLIKRKPQIYGRLIARCILLVPIPKFKGFLLHKSWKKLPLHLKLRTFFGSIRRIIKNKIWLRSIN